MGVDFQYDGYKKKLNVEEAFTNEKKCDTLLRKIDLVLKKR